MDSPSTARARLLFTPNGLLARRNGFLALTNNVGTGLPQRLSRYATPSAAFAKARRAGTRVRRALDAIGFGITNGVDACPESSYKRRYAFGLGRVVWRGPSTVYPDSAKVLLNLAPMMWQWQALGNLWYCQTAVSHPLVASVTQMPSGRPDQRLKHGREAELFPRSPDASAFWGSILRALGAARAQRRHRRATGPRRRRT